MIGNSFFSKWKFSWQILAFTSISLIVILLISFTVSLFLTKYIFQLLERSSNITFSKETSRQAMRYGIQQLYLIDSYFEDSIADLNKINTLFRYSKANLNISEPIDCAVNSKNFDSFAFYCVFCYDFCAKQPEQLSDDFKSLLKLSSLLTEYIGVFNFQRYTYFAGTQEEQFFAMHRSAATSTFRPHSRPWYKDHIREMGQGKRVVFSKPYFSVIDLVHQALTMNMTNSKGDLVGIASQDCDFIKIPKFSTESILPMIVAESGEMIISSYYEVNFSNIINIYDKDLTGFGQDDWMKIKLAAKRNEPVQLFNRKLNQNVLVAALSLEVPSYIVICQINDGRWLKDQERFFSEVDRFFDQSQTMSLLAAAVVLATCMFLQFITIRYLEGDLRQLRNLANNSIYKGYFLQNMEQSCKSRVTQDLFKAFVRLIDNSHYGVQDKFNRKNQACLEIESRKYPINIYDQRLAVEPFLHSLLNSNTEKVRPISTQNESLLKRCLKQYQLSISQSDMKMQTNIIRC